MRVLLTDRAWPDWELERGLLSQVGAELVAAPDATEATLVQLAANVDAIGCCWGVVNAAVIHAAKRCRIISRYGIGLDNIDIAAATACGIPVANVPDYCVEEVADHTLALLLALARRISFFHQQTKAGEYRLGAVTPPHRLSRSVLGLMGFGRIGQAVARRAQAFGMRVLAHSPSGDAHGTTCEMVSFDELLARSDYLSLHAPLTESTRGILNLPRFAAMKPTACLINTSRGPLISHADLWTALQQGLLAGAALDVFDPEPPALSDPLFQDPRVIATPHAAFTSQESLIELRTRATEHICQGLQGEKLEYLVNPDYVHGSKVDRSKTL